MPNYITKSVVIVSREINHGAKGITAAPSHHQTGRPMPIWALHASMDKVQHAMHTHASAGHTQHTLVNLR